MKKTLITLAALAGVAAAGTVDFSPEFGNNNLGGFGAVDFSIAEGSWLKSDTMDYDGCDAVTLQSITLGIYNTWYSNNNMTTGFGIGIYEKTSTGSWTLLGKTDWFSHSTNSYTGSHTFTVQDSVTLSTEKTYTMAFFAGQDYLNGLAIGSTRDSMVGAAEWKNGQPESTTSTLAAVGLKGTASDATNTSLLYTYNGTQAGWTPNVSLSTATTDVVPEPATATLSLLALAGLAARRRRK